MIFKNIDDFNKAFLISEYSLRLYSNWIFDSEKNMAKLNIADPVFEISHNIYIEKCYENDINTLSENIKNSYSLNFKNRITEHEFPYNKLVTEYPNWDHFESSWLVRSEKNISRNSIPGLIHHMKDLQQTYVKLYIPKVDEFYTFRVKHTYGSGIRHINLRLSEIINSA